MIKTIALILVSGLALHFARKSFIVQMHSFWSTIATDYMMNQLEQGLVLSNWRMDKIYAAIGSPRANYWKLGNWSISSFAVNSDAIKVLKHWKERNDGDHANQDTQESSHGPGRAEDAQRIQQAYEAGAATAPAYGQSPQILTSPVIGVDAIPTPTIHTSGKIISLSHAPYHRPFRRS